jgi:cobalamin synthase
VVVLQFAAVYALLDGGKKLAMLMCIAVISRCCSSLSLLCLKIIPQSSYAAMFRENTKAAHKVFVITIAVLAAVMALLYAGPRGLLVAAFVFMGFAAATAYSYRELKGTSGDLTGHSLVIAELSGLIALAVI